jgi:mono/diheme cytochrome c family protein
LSKLTVVCATLAGLVFLVLLGIMSGLYDVGADRPHTAAVRTLLGILRDRSIEHRAADIVVPALDDPARVREGAEHYSAMCVDCHLAPGITVSEIRAGLMPHPPNLAQQPIDPRVAFWAIKHGIKASGMPAWGQTHEDEEIWNIVSFVRQLPHMTPDDYRAITAVETSEDEHGHEHGHAHDHPDAASPAPGG